MQQKQRVEGPATVAPVPEVAPARSHAVPWILAGLAVLTIAFLALAGYMVLARGSSSTSVGLAEHAVAAWDSGKPAALSAVFAQNAVVVHSDGAKVVGLPAIAADAKSLGPNYAMSMAGSITVSDDGTYAATPYTFSGHGKGTGMLVLKIANGRIVREWNLEAAPQG